MIILIDKQLLWLCKHVLKTAFSSCMKEWLLFLPFWHSSFTKYTLDFRERKVFSICFKEKELSTNCFIYSKYCLSEQKLNMLLSPSGKVCVYVFNRVWRFKMVKYKQS